MDKNQPFQSSTPLPPATRPPVIKRKIGYARVSTEEQHLDLQYDALRAAGCEVIYEDRGISGAVAARPGLRRAMRALQPGDVLVVWRLDRLGRSLQNLIETMGRLQARGVGFRSVQEQIDTTSPAGRFYLHMLAALAEFERELIRDRTKAGMAAARARGVRLGRPPKLSPDKLTESLRRTEAGESLEAVADDFGVSVVTLKRALRRR
ncbi:recombinase family protein [Nitratireductor aquimarinus]|uniref:recombinase family protein n=1 Tax=Nitratireductor aquimarinus TaxID=889300 RepID=UPI00398EF033